MFGASPRSFSPERFSARPRCSQAGAHQPRHAFGAHRRRVAGEVCPALVPRPRHCWGCNKNIWLVVWWWLMRHINWRIKKIKNWWFGTFWNMGLLMGIFGDYSWLILVNNGELLVSGWWFGTMKFYDFPFSWEFHHPNWLIFFRGVGIPPTRNIRNTFRLVAVFRTNTDDEPWASITSTSTHYRIQRKL